MPTAFSTIAPTGHADLDQGAGAAAVGRMPERHRADHRATRTWTRSQAMIDGIANYTGDSQVEGVVAATAGIDAAIDDIIPVVKKHPNTSILSAARLDQPLDSIRANTAAISGSRMSPRDAISGTVWALLTHPDQPALVTAGKGKMARRIRGIRPLDRADPERRRDGWQPWSYRGVDRAGGSRVLHVRLANFATRPASLTLTASTSGATPRKASPLASRPVLLRRRGLLRARWSPTSRCPAFFRD